MEADSANEPGINPTHITQNLAAVRDRISRAAVRSGRTEADVELVAVTKTVGVGEVELLRGLGQTLFGENRVDEVRRKVAGLSQEGVPPRFDLIGTLQTNKVRQVVGLVNRIHSVDSTRLLEAIHARALSVGVRQDVLLQVNVSGEESKHGLSPVELQNVLQRAGELGFNAAQAASSHDGNGPFGVQVVGLMTMAPNLPPEQVRWVFSRLRTIRDEAAGSLPDGVQLAHLSMGMSNDFEVAIEEGATLVRVGSSLFRAADE